MTKYLFLSLFMGLIFGVFMVAKEVVPTMSEAIAIVSPLPSYLSNTSLVRGIDIWKPKDQVMSSQIVTPTITAQSALIYDITTDTALYEKNSKARLPIASLAKIMTAVVALEEKSTDAKFPVSQHAATIGENTMGLTAGEAYSLEELLYGLVLHSGNDAAEAIAEGVSGSSPKFVSDMNQKAQVLGLSNTRFVNPSGLEEDIPSAREYSTAYDVVVLTKYALSLPLFAKIAETVAYEIPSSNNHKYIQLYNQTNLLTTYPGVKGVKTGFTPSAGFCLVTYAENGGHKLIGVILNSQSRREEMRELLDFSFSTLGVFVPGRT